MPRACFPFILILGLSLVSNAYAQEEIFTPSIVVYLLPMELIDPNKPAYSGGLEFNFSDVWSIEISGGYSEFDRSGHKLRMEIKRYYEVTQEENKIVRRYWSLGGFYHHYTFDQEIIYDRVIDLEESLIVGVDKVSMGMDVRWGEQILFRKHISLEFFAGLGIIYIDRKHDGPYRYYLGSGFFSHPKTQGGKLAPKLSLGVKLGGWLN